MRPRVSLLGLGRMGLPIAGRLHADLGQLVVWNRTPAKTDPLRQTGAVVAATPRAAAAPVTITVLTDLADVERLLAGPNGLLVGWQAIPRPILIICGTVSPIGVAALAKKLARRGVEVLDAPLSGGVAGATSGALSVMVGGSTSAVKSAWDVLLAIGGDNGIVQHVGPVGAGSTAKACNQVVVAATVAAISEAMLLADATGIDRGQLLSLLGGGLAGSEVLRQKGNRWLLGDFDGGGSSRNQLKDLRFVTDTAASHRLQLPVAATLRAVFQQAVDDGEGDLDHSGVELSLRRHATAGWGTPC